MIHHRHIDELESAVRVARTAATTVGTEGPAMLSRHLYEHWYLGRDAQRPDAPAPSGDPVAYPTPYQAPWRAWGPLWTGDADHPGGLVRLHLSLVPPTALHALALVAARARGWDHPWELTSTALGDDWPTPESTVLSLPAAALLPLRPEVQRLVEDLKPFLSVGVPALTLRIGRGAALAQAPRDGHSFGQHRCAIVAAAVLDNLRVHHREQVERAMHALADAGVDPERPYRDRAGTWDRPWQAA